MSKVRVHELAKEYGLENKEVLAKLKKAGIVAKTHSSSVDADEARAAMGKTPKAGVSAESSAEVEAPKKKRTGLKIVRKRDKVEEPVVETPVIAQEADAKDVAVETVAEVEGPTVDVVSAAEASVASAQVEGSNTSTEPSADVADTAPTSAESDEPKVAQAEAAAEATVEDADKASPDKPKRSGAQVLRMIDRDKLLERVPGRRLGSDTTGGGGGNKQFGRVTELKVVQDPYGRGREMVQVGRDKKPGGGKGGAGAGKKGKGGAPSKREMMQMRERARHPSRLRKKRPTRRGGGMKTELTQKKASKRVVRMKETISVADLAAELQVKGIELVRKLFSMGVRSTLNHNIDFDTATLLADEYEYRVESIAFDEDAVLNAVVEEEINEEDLEPRPPVVTIMGHVDHGKTSLLDYIRRAKVADGEAGGITQHIGAYQVEVKGKGKITFLDTPGHAAFTEMRARGANVTDIVILVVAADDGVMPQTEEAIKHAQAAGVPIIVAVNKIDRAEANAERVTQELSQFSLIPEAWGGETIFIETSAIKGTGVDDLLESILLQAEVSEYKADPKRLAMGVVVEAKLDKGRGAVATLLVQQGTLKKGQYLVVGEHPGKVRGMTDYAGKQLKEAGPSTAVEVIGLSGVPNAGDQLYVVENEKEAREVSEHRINQRKEEETRKKATKSLDDLMARMKGEEAAELNLVLKADVQGSVEAVKSSIEQLSSDEVRVKVIYAGVGAISESDVMLCAASGGMVLGFGVRPDGKARQIAQREGIEIRSYKIIYEAIDEIQKMMEGLLEPDSKETIVGRAEVREVFRITKVGSIAGCRVVDGKAARAAQVRLLRDNVEVYTGRVSSLKHYKEDAREVDSGQECGVGIEGYNDIKEGDVIEFFKIEEVSRTLGEKKRA